MDRRPLERIVRWQPDCAATQQNDSAGFEGPQRSDNGCGLHTRSNLLAAAGWAPQAAPPNGAKTLDRARARTAKPTRWRNHDTQAGPMRNEAPQPTCNATNWKNQCATRPDRV